MIPTQKLKNITNKPKQDDSDKSDSFKFDDRFIGRRTNKVLIKKPEKRFDQFINFQSQFTSEQSDSLQVPRLIQKKDNILDEFSIDSNELQIDDKNKKRSSILWSYIEHFPENKMNSNFMLDINENSDEQNQKPASENLQHENYELQDEFKQCPTSKKDSKSEIKSEQNDDKQTNNQKTKHQIPPPIAQIQSKSSQPQKKKVRIMERLPKPSRIKEEQKEVRIKLQFVPILLPQIQNEQQMGSTDFHRRTRMQTLRYWLGQRKQLKKGKLAGYWIQKRQQSIIE